MRAYSRDRKDANDAKLSRIAVQLGAYIVHMRPEHGFDWLLAWQGHLYVVEIKDGEKWLSQRKLKKNEQRAKETMESRGVLYHVVESEADLFALLGVTPTIPHLRKTH